MIPSGILITKGLFRNQLAQPATHATHRRMTIFTLCLLLVMPFSIAWAEPNHYDSLDRAKRATVGILEDTQDPRTPEKPGKIQIRGTGFHLREGYLVTARHAVEKHSPSGHVIPKQILVL
ncbi:MAG: hypothetical protein NTX84_11105, partial [Nitrospirae bacterium]|nr:hypothetical protein [Nitrospirota bacterium]